jgi:hypothetical protein
VLLDPLKEKLATLKISIINAPKKSRMAIAVTSPGRAIEIGAAGAVTVTGVPHELQNRAPGASVFPHR